MRQLVARMAANLSGVISTMEILLILVIGIGIAFYVSSRNNKKQVEQNNQNQLDDARADAQRWIDRLGSQVYSIDGTDTASKQAMSDASERHNAAVSALSSATTVKQAQLARESALEGMHYANAARELMGMSTGPEIPPLEGQRNAGKVTERREIDHEGEHIIASPKASDDAPHYYPGGNVAGRPVPAGWYSTRWWEPALLTGVWAMSSAMMFSMMFAGMSGVGYSAQEFESGAGEGLDGADGAGADGMDGADGGDMDGTDDMGGMDDADDGGFFGGDDGGLFGGGGDDGGLFDLGFDF